MSLERVLPAAPLERPDDAPYGGNGSGLDAARKLGPSAVLEDLAASGLRGRGGAGFPTATKWAAAVGGRSEELPETVVVNAAEGEPGSYKDRALLQRNPYAVLEGALIAAYVVGADRVVIGTRASFVDEVAILERAITAIREAGWADDISVEVNAGPEEYLVGEETALLEVLDGRPPFPRVAPPYRRGIDDVPVELSDEIEPAATLVSNVETYAHVAAIMAEGPSWFREFGTDASPGTFVCTVSGPGVKRAGVGEYALGTPLQTIVHELGGGVHDGHEIVGVLPGVANQLVPGSRLGTPATYEDMKAIGSGLGCGAYLVYDDRTDLTALAHGVSRFLAVESCGQCTPCKQDGLAISQLLDRVRTSEGEPLDLLAIAQNLETITNSARCYLAEQHQRVVGSIMQCCEPALRAHVEPGREIPPAEPVLIAPIVRIRDGVAEIEEHFRRKQPDWTFDPVDSGQAPADRYGASRPHHAPPE
jgi:NADH:ubiquinone oxidoreductase subunit F (NADH-binding)